MIYETVRQWCLKFGQTDANKLRRRRPRCGDKWHMDEVVLPIRGQKHSLWRAVDQHGNVLDILVQSRRDKKVAKRCFRNLLKELQYVPRLIIPDMLRSYGAAKREISPGVEHRQHKRLNNRAENSHQPTRLREKKMRRFKSTKQAQRFFSAFGPLARRMRNEKHLWLKELHRLVQCPRFLLARDQKYLDLMEAGASRMMFSSQMTNA